MARKGKKRGRKEKITKDILSKLEDAFTNGMTDEQACTYAGIGSATLYRYQLKRPQFRERKVMLKLRPDIRAHQTIVRQLDDINTAKWWAERRMSEFKPVSKVEHSGSVEVIETPMKPLTPEEVAAFEAVKKARRNALKNQANELVKNNETIS